MNESPVSRFVGIDVSAATFHVVVDDQPAVSFANDAKGHAALVARLTKRPGRVRVVVEATSLYHLDLCVALAGEPRIEVMVANPRTTHAFSKWRGGRGKTDAMDAAMLRDFAQTATFDRWTAPAAEVLDMRAVARYVDQLTRDLTALKNQLHAASATTTTPEFVRTRLEKRIRDVEAEIALATAELVAIAKRHPYIAKHLQNLTSMPGIGERTATRLVAEFLVLDPTMTSKQIAAWAGLNPTPRESGTSVRGKARVSKRGNARVRHALYMPALSVSFRENEFANFYNRLAARPAPKMVALTATMRKLLTVAWALFRTNASYDAKRVQPRKAST